MTIAVKQFPNPPVHMKLLAGQTVNQFGYDQISNVNILLILWAIDLT